MSRPAAQFFDSLNQYGYKATCVKTRAEKDGTVRVFAVCFYRSNLARTELTFITVATQALANAWVAAYRAADQAAALAMVLAARS